jgi:flagellar hook-length control protein FliK
MISIASLLPNTIPLQSAPVPGDGAAFALALAGVDGTGLEATAGRQLSAAAGTELPVKDETDAPMTPEPAPCALPTFAAPKFTTTPEPAAPNAAVFAPIIGQDDGPTLPVEPEQERELDISETPDAPNVRNVRPETVALVAPPVTVDAPVAAGSRATLKPDVRVLRSASERTRISMLPATTVGDTQIPSPSAPQRFPPSGVALPSPAPAVDEVRSVPGEVRPEERLRLRSESGPVIDAPRVDAPAREPDPAAPVDLSTPALRGRPQVVPEEAGLTTAGPAVLAWSDVEAQLATGATAPVEPSVAEQLIHDGTPTPPATPSRPDGRPMPSIAVPLTAAVLPTPARSAADPAPQPDPDAPRPIVVASASEARPEPASTAATAPAQSLTAPTPSQPRIDPTPATAQLSADARMDANVVPASSDTRVAITESARPTTAPAPVSVTQPTPVEPRAAVTGTTPAPRPVRSSDVTPTAPTPTLRAIASGPAAQVFATEIRRALRDARAPVLELMTVAPPAPLDAGVRVPELGAPVDIANQRWPQEMVARIERLRDAADAADTSIRLAPDALGSVEVSVRREGDAVHVRFTAEEAATRALLQEAAPRLAEAAEARGLKLGQTSVGTGGGDRGGADAQGRQQQPTPHSTTPSRPPRSSAEREEAAGVRIA